MPRDPEELYGRLLALVEGQSDRCPTACTWELIGVLKAVLELHKPEPGWHQSRFKFCYGCDMDGYETEHPEWPCRTVRTIAHVLGEATDA